jgi:hypothetical protein
LANSKNFLRRILGKVGVAGFCGATLLSGCATVPNTGGGNTPPPEIQVTVTPTSMSVQAGSQTSLTATVANDSKNAGVNWTVSGTGCTGAACGTLSATSSASGVSVMYTAPSAVPNPASVTVTATSASDSSRSMAATITITATPAISVGVSPGTANVQVGSGTQKFTATVTNDTQNKGVSWKLSGAGCTGAACGTLSASTSASGTAITYSAPGSLPNPATITITATSVADTTKSGPATITLTAAPVISVTTAPTTATVQAGIGTQSFAATVTNDAQNKGVGWKLSGAGCSGATCGALSATTSASGTAITYSAPASVPTPATVTITATSVTDTTKSAPATITVSAGVSVVVAPTTATVQTGSTQTFAATVSNDSQNKGVNWTLSGAGCSGATCGTLSNTSSASGVGITYTAPAVVPTPATVTLTAASVRDTTKNASATITVTAASGGTVSVSLTPKRGGLTLGQSQAFTATVINDVGSAGVTWSASAGSFSAQSTTTATYVAPATAGAITVTAASVADGSKSASVTIGVTDLAGVTTYHNDLSRDGVNAKEYALTTANVATATFGKLFSCSTDGAMYAQPLWVANLNIGGGTHNVIFAATTHDSVYAFDADTNPCVKYWNKSLLGIGETYVSSNDVGTGDIQPDVGIIGTPVIDAATNTLYVVSKSKTNGTSCTPATSCFQRLHALSLIDGTEKFGGPVNITSAISVPGTGDGSSGGNVTFNTLRENQRPGLVLSNGVVYVAWASHGDNGPYHGWVVGFDKTTLAQVSMWNANPNGSDSGIWMGGGAPAADSSGNLYFLTGNGTFDLNTGGSDYGDSTVRLSTSGGLTVAGYFTPADQQNLENGDADHGSGGAAILVDQPNTAPHQHLMLGGGKEGNIFVLDRDNMGGYGASVTPNDSNAVQKFNVGNGIFSTAAFFNNALYIAGAGGRLKMFAFNTTTGQFIAAQTSQSPGSFGFPGATPSVSASGTSNGIIWAMNNNAYCTQQSSSCGATVLHAYDATNVGTELWNSSQTAGDAAGNAVKFTVPTVANGKVYLGTRGNDTGNGGTSVPGEVDVYGLKPN